MPTAEKAACTVNKCPATKIAPIYLKKSLLIIQQGIFYKKTCGKTALCLCVYAITHETPRSDCKRLSYAQHKHPAQKEASILRVENAQTNLNHRSAKNNLHRARPLAAMPNDEPA